MKLSALSKAWEEVRSGITPLFLFVAACCMAVIGMVWYLELFDDVAPRILVSSLVAVVPLGVYFSKKAPELKAYIVWFTAFLVVVLLLALSDKFNSLALQSNALLLFLALPYAWVVWQLMRRNPLLLTGLALALGMMMIYWTAALMRESDSLNLLLVPLPVVLFLGIPWALVAGWILKQAKRLKFRRVAGPGIQALAMAALFLPAIVVAIFFPRDLELGQAWSAVSLTLVGVLLSAVIAEPLRRFLLEWGNLTSKTGNL